MAVRMSSGDVEIAGGDVLSPYGIEPFQHLFDGKLGLTAGVDRSVRRFFGNKTVFRLAVGRGGRAEHDVFTLRIANERVSSTRRHCFYNTQGFASIRRQANKRRNDHASGLFSPSTLSINSRRRHCPCKLCVSLRLHDLGKGYRLQLLHSL